MWRAPSTWVRTRRSAARTMCSIRWVQMHGRRVVGPPREVYLNEPAVNVVPLTEVQMPIA